MTFYEYIRNIFIILIFLQLAPSLLQGIRKQYQYYFEPSTQVGVITLKGILYDSSSYSRQLYSFFKNPDIKAILLKIECPGSASGTGHALFNEIQMLKKEFPKPIISLVENTCASGGYLIACATDHIIAPSAALIGSIGVMLPYFFQIREFLEEHKIRMVELKAGEYKSIGSPMVDLTPEQRTLLQTVLNDAYEQFTAVVSKARKIPLSTLNEWADGKIFTSNQAHKLGLIDEIGSAYNAIAIIKEKALIEGEIQWVYPAKQRGILGLFSSDDYEDGSLLNSLFHQCTNILTSHTTTLHL